LDEYGGEERWQTIGQVGVAVILVVHTMQTEEQSSRIITTRNATHIERRHYEEGEF
jgi:uncharacterized DUF497 family protein